MEFNPSKCKIMGFASKRDPPKQEYVFCGKFLEVESHPYLGVALANKMRWSLLIEVIISEANNANCPKSVNGTAYTALMRPKLQCVCSVWDPHNQKDKAALERVH